jgi:hypothetical protein
MSGEIVYAAVFIAVLVWWMWRANNPKKKPGPPPASASTTLGKPRGRDSDPFLSAIDAERLAAEREVLDEENAYKRAIEAQVVDDEKLKARLAKFARDNELDAALTKLWDEIRHYPAWSKRDDWQQWNKLGIESPSEEESADLGTKTLHFGYEGTRYSIATRDWYGMEATSYKDFQLLENGEEVFAISCEVVHDDPLTWYSPLDVKAFKRRGNWASMLVRLSAKNSLESEKSSANFRARRASDIKQRFAE